MLPKKQDFCPKKAAVVLEAVMKGATRKEACERASISTLDVILWTHFHPEFKTQLEAGLEGRRQSILEAIYEHDIKPLTSGGYDGDKDNLDGVKARLEVFERYLKLHFPGKHKEAGSGGDINIRVIIDEAQKRARTKIIDVAPGD